MKLPGIIELNDEIINGNGQRVIHIKAQDANSLVPAIIELGVIPEINFIKGLLEKICEGFDLPQNKPIIIAGPDINHLSYILGLLIGLQNGAISILEDQDGESFHYTRELNNNSIIDNSDDLY